MSDDIIPAPDPDDAPDMAAGELALGVLEGEDRAYALRRVVAERGFAQDVERWRLHLAQFFDRWPDMPAPAGVFERVERSIDASGAPVVVPMPPRRLFWPVAAGLSSVAAAALLVVIVTRPALVPVPPAPRPAPSVSAPAVLLAASIAPVGAGAPVTAIYDQGSANLRLTAAAFADADRSAELWVIAGDGVPHSLGLLRKAGGSTFIVKRENRVRLAAGSVLAVSLEPIGGSPTGLPTGPVVAKGALSQV